MTEYTGFQIGDFKNIDGDLILIKKITKCYVLGEYLLKGDTEMFKDTNKSMKYIHTNNNDGDYIEITHTKKRICAKDLIKL